ncbi:MAG: S1C family serine protease [Thermodesulfobacteriota bacterium]
MNSRDRAMGIHIWGYIALLTLFLLPTITFASEFPAKEIYGTYSPSVVVIRAVRAGGGGMIGAGSVISHDGLVITNAHVIIDKRTGMPYSRIRVSLKPARLTGRSSRDLSLSYKAVALYYDKKLDLALLRVQGLSSGKRIISLAAPDTVMVGTEVIAIGHPEQGGFWSLTYGRISGEMSDYGGVSGKDVYQTDTSVNRGNSGGPLLDSLGRMVAVNSNMARVGRGGIPITGVNFAIKSSVVKRWLKGHGLRIAYAKSPATKKVIVAPAEKGGKMKLSEAPEDKKAVKKETGERGGEKAALSSGGGDLKKKKKEAIKFRVDVKGADDDMHRTAGEKARKKESLKSEKKTDRFFTDKKPYDYDSLLQAAEKDLENMMRDMKQKIRRSR